jgi:hypothetical protein
LQLLSTLAEHQDETRMTINNLGKTKRKLKSSRKQPQKHRNVAIVVAPNILYAEVQTHATTLEMPSVAGVVAFLVAHARAILVVD